MKKKLFLAGMLCLFFCAKTFAQMNNDSSRSTKKTMHLVGLQANGLFRQILNFGNANNPVNNPYLLTYSMISTRSKTGFDLGAGYTLNNVFENDGNTKKENYTNDLYCRLGVVKLVPLNKRFSTTLNFHVIVEALSSKTNTTADFGGQITEVNSNTTSLRYGGGPCLGLRFKVSNRVFLGTEANYYFKMGKNKSKVITTTSFPGQQQTTTTITESNNDLKQFVLNTPTVIFLAIRF